MNEFSLTVVTPDGIQFDGMAQELIVRTVSGDLAVLAGHENLVCPLGMGQAVVVTAEGRRTAACIGGILTVLGGMARLVPTTFEWSDKIDLARARDAEKRAREQLKTATEASEIMLAEARLKRALVRQSAAAGVPGR